MKQLSLIFLLILSLFVFETLAANDTTYSTIRIKKKKQKKSSGSSKSSSSSCLQDDEDDDDEAPCLKMLDGCLAVMSLISDIQESREARKKEKEQSNSYTSVKSPKTQQMTYLKESSYATSTGTIHVWQSMTPSNNTSSSIDSAMATHSGNKSINHTTKDTTILTQTKREAIETSLDTQKNKPDYFEKPVHLTLGVTSGYAFHENKIAQGASLGLPFSLRWHCTQHFGLRLITEPTIQGSQMNIDFERDIFVNSVKSGTQTFVTKAYETITVPVRLDIQLFPPSETNIFFFTLGGGVAYEKESVSGSINSSPYKAKYIDWHPTCHIGLGWQINRTSIEIAYNVYATSPKSAIFVPMDNSDFHGTLTAGVSIALF